MDEMQGMAAMGAQGIPNSQMTVKDVIAALMQGIQPEDLVKMGVPEQMIQQAMMQLEQQTQPQDPNAGLAGMQLNQMKG